MEAEEIDSEEEVVEIARYYPRLDYQEIQRSPKKNGSSQNVDDISLPSTPADPGTEEVEGIGCFYYKADGLVEVLTELKKEKEESNLSVGDVSLPSTRTSADLGPTQQDSETISEYYAELFKLLVSVNNDI